MATTSKVLIYVADWRAFPSLNKVQYPTGSVNRKTSRYGPTSLGLEGVPWHDCSNNNTGDVYLNGHYNFVLNIYYTNVLRPHIFCLIDKLDEWLMIYIIYDMMARTSRKQMVLHLRLSKEKY